jgi:cytochrome o ubiquinol oxidase subunit 1
VIIGGVVFGMFAGITYWFPKAFGFKLDEFWGKLAFWFWVAGYWFAFTPLYVLGLMGVTRRLRHFDDPSLQIWFLIAAFGAFLVALGILSQLIMFYVSIRDRNTDRLRDTTGDPWGGRTLEWATSSPPPAYNFAFTPVIHDLDAWYDMKSRNHERPVKGYRAILMPRNTPAGLFIAVLSAVCGVALIWYVWWLAALSLIGVVATAIHHSYNYDREFHIPMEEVASTEDARSRSLAALER